jgi:hypothetical protein
MKVLLMKILTMKAESGKRKQIESFCINFRFHNSSFIFDPNPDLMQFANLKIIAGPDQRGRAVLFDDRRARAAEARFQRITAIDLRVGPAAGAPYIDAPLMRGLGFDRRAG